MTFGVMGGDGRQRELAKLLKEEGHTVYGPGEEALRGEILILPLPLEKDGLLNWDGEPLPLKELFSRLAPEQRVFAGQVGQEARRAAEKHGVMLEDYFLREELTVKNAAITAECAIRLARERQSFEHVLVLGFGRIGKLLCHRLQRQGIRVTAAARRPEDLAWARAYGYEALNIRQLSEALGTFDLIFNTVPAPVLGPDLLGQVRCLIIDLASEQGIEGEAPSYIWARGLPGRMDPKGAAAAIRETVYHILTERRGDNR